MGRATISTRRRFNYSKALRTLVAKLDAVHADPRYAAVWTMYQVHGGRYTEPTYTVEFQQAKDALAALERASSLAPVAPADWQEFVVAAFCEGFAAVTSMKGAPLSECWLWSHVRLELDHQGVNVQDFDSRLLAARDRVAPPSTTAEEAENWRECDAANEDALTRTGELAADPAPQHASTDTKV